MTRMVYCAIKGNPAFCFQWRRQVVAPIRGEEDGNAQPAARGRLDEAPHQVRGNHIGHVGFGMCQKMKVQRGEVGHCMAVDL